MQKFLGTVRVGGMLRGDLRAFVLRSFLFVSSVKRQRAIARRSVALGWACMASACMSGPDYERPKVPVPAAFRGGATAAPSAALPLAAQPWAEVFDEAELKALLEVALQHNYDLLIAGTRVLQARARLGIADAARWPTLVANASAGAQRLRFGGRGEPVNGGLFQVGATAAWELDFWGRFARASEAARAELLGSEWARRAVVTTLVSQVATLYFNLRALDRQLDIARRTLSSREESLRLTQVREQGGTGSLVDVKQAEQLVHGVKAQLVDLERLAEQGENALSVLLGRWPGPVARAAGRAPAREAQVPAGLPSALLERRPDIQMAEQRLVAANAEIGVARAAYFPRINLTASGGVASSALSTLLSGPALVWSAAASASQPIIDGGRIRSDVRRAEAVREEALLGYRQAILQAFREVSDALVAHQRGGELLRVQEDLVSAAQEARRLAELRYRGGAADYLEVIDSDTRLFSAELGRVQAELAEISAFVELYRALGGGWQT